MRRIFSILLVVLAVGLQAQELVSLNGQWLMGEGRCYAQTVNVPSVHTDPTRMNSDTLWYNLSGSVGGAWCQPTAHRERQSLLCLREVRLLQVLNSAQ